MKTYKIQILLLSLFTMLSIPNFALGKKAAGTKIDGLSPTGIKNAYSMTSSLDGSGQTLALFALDGFSLSDIEAYESAFDLPSITIDTVLVDGATGIPGDDADEVTASIELMMALAPGISKIIVYEGVNSAAGILSTYNQIASDNLANALATSWGSPESATPGSLVSAEALVFKQMVAQGQVIFAASGDKGAYADGENLSVLDPASQSLVIAVGGTTLTLDESGNYGSETTWFDSLSNAGSGGGISSLWNTTLWQQQVTYDQPGISYTMRSIPDVTLNADPTTGYAIYFNGAFEVFGGTSAATALWTAFSALANEAMINSDGSPLGFLAPLLYQVETEANFATYYNDIMNGSTNGYPLYEAVYGYDVPTGLGSPSIDNLIGYFLSTVQPPNTCETANPIVALLTVRQVGAPGDSLPYMVYISNQDSPQCGLSTYNLSKSIPSGFSANLDQTSVTLQPGGNSLIAATLTSPINASAADYHFSIAAVNASNSALHATTTGIFQVLTNRQTMPTLMIQPINGTVFSKALVNWAHFGIIMSANGEGVNDQLIDIIVTGPDSWQAQAVTEGGGSFQYFISINDALEIGDYLISVSTDYEGSPVSAELSFSVTE